MPKECDSEHHTEETEFLDSLRGALYGSRKMKVIPQGVGTNVIFNSE